jgi:hypothetical protein
MYIVKIEDSPIYHMWVRENHITNMPRYEIENTETGKQVVDRSEFDRVKNSVLTTL